MALPWWAFIGVMALPWELEATPGVCRSHFTPVEVPRDFFQHQRIQYLLRDFLWRNHRTVNASLAVVGTPCPPLPWLCHGLVWTLMARLMMPSTKSHERPMKKGAERPGRHINTDSSPMAVSSFHGVTLALPWACVGLCTLGHSYL